MAVLEINGLKYSQDQFGGYEFRGIFKFNLGGGKFKSIDIYTTDSDYHNVLKFLNKRKKEKVLSVDLYHWQSRDQDDQDSEVLFNCS